MTQTSFLVQSIPTHFDLRDYQLKSLSDVETAFTSLNRVILTLPTGAGKTVVASEKIRRFVSQFKRVLFLAHRRELVFQCSDKLKSFGVDHGIIMSGETKSFMPDVQVASIQTLMSRIRNPKYRKPDADLIIIDEAHHAIAKSYIDLINHYPSAKILGLTATPVRGDGRGLGELFQLIIEGPTIAELTEEGHLVPCEYYAPVEPDLKGVKTIAGDYAQDQLADVMDKATLIGDIVENWGRICPDRQTVVFASSVAHSLHIRDAFRNAGVNAEHVDGSTPKSERDKILSALKSGDIRLVSNCMVLTEGWDCLDRNTEILTTFGWRGIGEVKQGDNIFSMNKETNNMEIVKVDDYGEREVRDGEMMATIKSQHLDIRVTEGHQFHIKYRDHKSGDLSKNWLIKTGRELSERNSAYSLPLSAEPNVQFPGLPLSDDEIKFVAWFMTDGGFCGTTSVEISQGKEYHNEIKNLLVRMGIDFKETIRKNVGGFKCENPLPIHIFRIPKWHCRNSINGHGWEYLSPYLDKNVSPLLHNMTRRQFIIFWDEMLKGNGDVQEGKSGWLWCNKKEQADAFTQMAILRGMASSYNTRVTKNGVTMYVVSVRDKKWITSDPSDKRASKISLEQPKKGEIVWCVRNKNSTLVTRRNGKIAIIGNCPATSCCVLARPTKSISLYLQMAGRILRPYANKTNAIIIDHSGSVKRHGFIDEPKEWSLDGNSKIQDRIAKAKKEQGEPGFRTCPECHCVYQKKDRCPSCGWCPPKKAENVEVIDGILGKVERNGKIVKVPMIQPERAIAELSWIQQIRGYKKGWVGYNYKEIFGKWPRNVDCVPVEPSTEILAWVNKKIKTYRRK